MKYRIYIFHIFCSTFDILIFNRLYTAFVPASFRLIVHLLFYTYRSCCERRAIIGNSLRCDSIRNWDAINTKFRIDISNVDVTNENWGCYFIEPDAEVSSLPHECHEKSSNKIIIIARFYILSLFHYVSPRR